MTDGREGGVREFRLDLPQNRNEGALFGSAQRERGSFDQNFSHGDLALIPVPIGGVHKMKF